MSAPRLCKDCRHYQANEWANLDKCLHPSFTPPPDLVRGADAPTYCNVLRMAGKECGPDAAGFEAKVRDEL